MSSAYVGEIRVFAGTFAPVNWVLCDGRSLEIRNYEALYALIGTTYGGDGRTTFKVPDLQGRLPIGTGPANGDINKGGTSAYVPGQSGGATSVTLTTAQLPNHTHSLMATTTAASQISPAGQVLADPSDDFNSYIPYNSTVTNRVMADQALSAEGGNSAHDNIMPSMPLTHIICVNGLFPYLQN
jgi:microcystin-dependent protein